MVRYRLVRRDIGAVRRGVVRYGMVRYGIARYVVLRYDMFRYDVIRCGKGGVHGTVQHAWRSTAQGGLGRYVVRHLPARYGRVLAITM